MSQPSREGEWRRIPTLSNWEKCGAIYADKKFWRIVVWGQGVSWALSFLCEMLSPKISAPSDLFPGNLNSSPHFSPLTFQYLASADGPLAFFSAWPIVYALRKV